MEIFSTITFTKLPETLIVRNPRLLANNTIIMPIAEMRRDVHGSFICEGVRVHYDCYIAGK